MPKSFVRLLFYLHVFHEAHALTCYTSNSSLLSGNLQNLKHKLQDCREYISEMTTTEAPMPADQVLHCFTIGADYLDIMLKGCLPEGRCDSMVEVFRKIIQISGVASVDAIGNVNCQECEENACNSEEEDSFFVLNNFTSTMKTSAESGKSNGNSHGLDQFFVTVCYLLCYVVNYL